MKPYAYIFLVLLASVLYWSGAVGDDSPKKGEGDRQDKAQSPSDGGRYTVSSYRDTLVLVDTNTGETWILKARADSVAWFPVPRIPHEDSQAVVTAKTTTEHGVSIQMVPELDMIMLRGSKDDVERTLDVLKRVEKSTDSGDAND